MTEAPREIWLLPFDGEQRCWADDPDPSGLGHEAEADRYIRADLVSDLLREGCNLMANEYDNIKASITMPDGSLSKNPLDRRAVETVEAMDDWIKRAGDAALRAIGEAEG